MSSRFPLLVLLSVALLIFGGCDSNESSDPDPEAALFRVEVCSDQTFLVQITDPQVISEAEQLIGQEQQPVLSGDLARGNGGFNQPWSWHMEPGSIRFSDATIEVCDGCPHMVEEDLDYWIDTVGQFCPWTSRITQRVD